MITGGILSAAVIVGLVFLHRFYKHVGRRCDCGEMWQNYHESKIRLPSEENFDPYIIPRFFQQIWRDLKKPFGKGFKDLYKTLKEFRWWIREAQLVTFSVCPCCPEKGLTIKVVTLSNRSISLWHLYWVWYRDRGQFYDNPMFNFVLEGHLRELRFRKMPSSKNHQNPGFKITLLTEEKTEEN